MSAALEKIAALLADELAQHDQHGEPYDPEIVRLAVRRIRAQIEMIDGGMSDG